MKHFNKHAVHTTRSSPGMRSSTPATKNPNPLQKTKKRPQNPEPLARLLAKTNPFFWVRVPPLKSFSHPKASESSCSLRRDQSSQTHFDMGQDFFLLDTRYHNAAAFACGVLAFVRASAIAVPESIATAGHIAHVYRSTVGVLRVFVRIEILLRAVIFRTARKVTHETQIATVRVLCTFVRGEI
jgi:hypothetical protein